MRQRVRAWAIPATVGVLAGLLAGCARMTPPSPAADLSGASAQPTPATSDAPAQPAGNGAITIAFGGDSNVEGSAGSVLSRGMGKTGEVLKSADIALVNLETAVADNRSGLVGQPKQFTFVAPSSFLDLLARTGVDAVSVANNHGLDFGRLGLTRTLAARKDSRPPMIGIGADDTEAWRPWETTVKGRKVVVFAASDVLDAGFDWAAGSGRSGMALTKTDQEYARLRDAVRGARNRGPDDAVVVFLHAGVERVVCPTPRQKQLANDLSADGADIVAMSHAHVMQPSAIVGRTAVLYGLGNFIFSSGNPVSARSGVVSVTLSQGQPPQIQLHPATIQGGVPVLDTGSAVAPARARWENLGKTC